VTDSGGVAWVDRCWQDHVDTADTADTADRSIRGRGLRVGTKGDR
jgi:hypothetical protein